uniref:hypothetical protein n=1 Tax=Brevundimonas sp. LF-1 TaxID=3126100 RepID=UPI00403DA7EE
MSDVRPDARPDARSAALKALLFASSAAGMLCAAPALAAVADETSPSDGVISQDATHLGTVDVHGHRVKREPKDPQFVAPWSTPRARSR